MPCGSIRDSERPGSIYGGRRRGTQNLPDPEKIISHQNSNVLYSTGSSAFQNQRPAGPDGGTGAAEADPARVPDKASRGCFLLLK